MAEITEKQKISEMPKESCSQMDVEVSREQLVATAVKFLQNQKVRLSPLTQKKAFLQSKGLTNDEIEQAFALSGVKDAPTEKNNLAVIPFDGTPVPFSHWSRARDISFVVLIICGATYGLYQLVRRYIFPNFNIQSESDDFIIVNKKIDGVQESMNQLLEKLCSSINDLHCDIRENQQKLDEMYLRFQNNQISQKPKEDLDLQEMKKEIASLKGLLLNRHSFPPPPTLQSVPMWQIKDLQTSNDSEIKDDDNDKNTSPDNIITSNGSRSWELVSGGDSEETETEANSSGV